MFKKALWRWFERKKKCKTCMNMTCISNYSPCYTCYKFSNYRYWDPKDMPEEERTLRNLD